jgi:TolA-binding protein
MSQDLSEYFHTGVTAFNKGDYAKAISDFESLLNSGIVDDEIISTAEFYIAKSLEKLNKLDGAVNKYESFLQKYFHSEFRPLALYTLGTIYNEKNLFEKSREKLFELVVDYPNHRKTGSALYWIGESYLSEDRYTEAQEYFTKALESESNNYKDYTIYSLASLKEKLKKYKEAVYYYDRILSYHKSSELAPSAQLRIGICYFNLGEYDNVVIELSDPLINELPLQQKVEAKTILANSFYKLREYENAADTYDDILKFYPEKISEDKVKYGLAWVNFKMNDYSTAFTYFDELANSANDTIAQNSLYLSGECKRNLGETEDALEIFKLVLEHDNFTLRKRALFNTGIIYFQRQNYDDAEKYLVESSEAEELNIKARSLTILGEIYLSRKSYKTAKDYFYSAKQLDGVDEELLNRSLLGLGISQYYLNDFENASLNLNELISRNPRFEESKVNFYLAEVYFAKGQFENTITHYNRIDESDELLKKQALYGKAYAYFNMKDFANSSYYFEEYLKQYPDNDNYFDVGLRLAESYYGLKNFNKASDIYAKLFSGSTDKLNDAFTFYQYAQALFKANRTAEAIKALNDLQRRFRNSRFSDDSQYLIGWIYFQHGDFNKAIQNYLMLFDKYPKSPIIPIAYYSIGDSYFNLGDYDSAISYYTQLIDKYPDTKYVFDAINGIQYCYIAKDQPDNAISLIDIFIDNNPDSKFADQILFKKGEIYFSMGNYAKAAEGYKELINRFPQSSYVPNAYYWVGKSYLNTGKTEDAKQMFQLTADNHLKSDVGISSVLELGAIYNKEKNYFKEVEIYNYAINAFESSSRVPELLYFKGVAQKLDGDIQSAYNTFDRIIKFFRETVFSAKAKIELGTLELERESYENAELLFKQLGAERTDDIGAEAQYNYGLTLFNQDKINEAISALVRVRSIFSMYDEWYTKSLLKLGDCYVKLGDKKNAREMFRAVIKKHRNDAFGAEAREKLNRL